MANQFLAANLIPRWEEREPTWKKVNDLQDYLFKLREGLEYELQNLDTKNFSKVFNQQQAEAVTQIMNKSMGTTLEAVKGMQNILELMKREEDVLTIGAEGKTVALVGTVTVNGRELNAAADD